MFYTLRGQTAKGIATILGLSKRTVESYIDHIKNKMACYNKPMLIEKAIDCGYMDIVPPGILQEKLPEILH